MTTSGSVSFNPTALQIITEALALIRVGVEDEPLTAAAAQDAMRTLNLMTKAWQADGLHLWTKERGVLFLTTAQPQYGLGGAVSTHSTLASDLAHTQIATDGISGASSITVDNASGIANGDYIGIELDNETMQWTTVNGAPSGSTVALTTVLSDSVSDGNIVYAYSTKLLRPTRLLQAQRRAQDQDPLIYTDVPMIVLERPDYFSQANKLSQSFPNQIYYSPQLVTGVMYVWPVSENYTDTIRFTFERPIEDFSTLVNTADFPQEWIETLSWNLAYRLSSKYSFPLDERTQLGVIAETMKQKLLSFDREYGSVYIQPDFQSMGGFGWYGPGYGGGYGGGC